MGKAYKHMHPVEVALAKDWTKEEKMSPNRIATLLRRSPGVIRKHLAKQAGALDVGVGRPSMPESDYKKCDRALVFLQKRAKGEKEVTAAMVKQHSGVKYCEKVIRKAFARHGKPFKRLREKPLLTEGDILVRNRFSCTHSKKSEESWVDDKPDATIDNKKYVCYLDQKARSYVARRSVRGGYRSGKETMSPHLVKPKASLKFPAKGVIVTAGVIKGRVRFWHYVEGRWNAEKAKTMYTALEKALAKASPERAARKGNK